MPSLAAWDGRGDVVVSWCSLTQMSVCRWSWYGETMWPTVAGRPFSPMKTLSRTSWSVCCGCAAALHSPSARSSKEACPLSVSCTCMAAWSLWAAETRASSSIRWLTLSHAHTTTDMPVTVSLRASPSFSPHRPNLRSSECFQTNCICVACAGVWHDADGGGWKNRQGWARLLQTGCYIRWVDADDVNCSDTEKTNTLVCKSRQSLVTVTTETTVKGGKIFTLHQKFDAFNLKEQRRSVFEDVAETELYTVITDYLFF